MINEATEFFRSVAEDITVDLVPMVEERGFKVVVETFRYAQEDPESVLWRVIKKDGKDKNADLVMEVHKYGIQMYFVNIRAGGMNSEWLDLDTKLVRNKLVKMIRKLRT